MLVALRVLMQVVGECLRLVSGQSGDCVADGAHLAGGHLEVVGDPDLDLIVADTASR